MGRGSNSGVFDFQPFGPSGVLTGYAVNSIAIIGNVNVLARAVLISFLC